MSDRFRVAVLSDHFDAVSTIAGWVWKSWGYPNRNDCERDLRRSRQATIPVGYVALEREKPLGVVNLIECNLPTRCHLSPWLAGLYVQPRSRHLGVGTMLVEFLEDHAAALGFRVIYLYTENAEKFYERLGWRTIERTRWEGEKIAVMTKSVSPPRRRFR